MRSILEVGSEQLRKFNIQIKTAAGIPAAAFLFEY